MYLFMYAEPARREHIHACTQPPSLGLLSWLVLDIHQLNHVLLSSEHTSLTHSLTHSLDGCFRAARDDEAICQGDRR